jgi:hypothetical protein
MIRAAYLRVYLPAGDAPSYPQHVGDATATVMRGNDHFLWAESITDDAFAVEWNDRRYVCPRHPRLRMLEGLLAFNNAFPETVLIPESEVASAGEELSALRDTSPTMRSHILTSPWHVPIRWFAAFYHEERELYDGADGLSIRYRARLGDALERVGRAAQIIDGAGFQAAIVHQIRGLESWLEDFPPDALLELDYGNVATLFSEGDLVLDESAADAAASLKALENGNLDEAGTFYAAVARRWGPVQSLAFAN